MELLSSSVQKFDDLADDERDISPNRKHSRTKQKRKVSTVSTRDNEKSKNKSNKNRTLQRQETSKKNDTLNINPIDKNNLSPRDGSETETLDKDTNDDTEELLQKMTLDENNIGYRLKKIEATKSLNNTLAAHGFSLTLTNKLSWPQENRLTNNVTLADKLAHNNEVDITGIMNLAGMNVNDDDLPAIIERAFSKGRKKCVGLILRDNNITALGVKFIVDALLAGPTNLKHFSLSNNIDIGDAGVEHLTRLLKNKRSILSIAISCTNISDRAVRLLADVLCGVNTRSSCSPLEKLYISVNKSITDQSLETLLQILEQNQTLTLLSVEYCSLSDQARKQLRQAASKFKKKRFSLAE